MKRILILTLICGALISTGCSSRKYANNSNALLLQYMEDNSQANLVNLSKAYGTTLSRTIRESRPEAGACAEYAVTLAKLNQPEQANTWFNLEVHYYPGAAKFVEQMKYDLIPQYADDTTTNATAVDLPDAATATEQTASAAVSNDKGSTQNTKVKLSKKDKKKLARQKKRAKMQAKKQKKKALRAKIKEKKRAKRDAAKLKAQAQKEKTAAKKQSKKSE